MFVFQLTDVSANFGHGSQKPKNTFTFFKRCTSYLASAGLSKGWFLPPEGHFEAFLAPSGHHEDDLPIEKCKGILGRLEPKMNRAENFKVRPLDKTGIS